MYSKKQNKSFLTNYWFWAVCQLFCKYLVWALWASCALVPARSGRGRGTVPGWQPLLSPLLSKCISPILFICISQILKFHISPEGKVGFGWQLAGSTPLSIISPGHRFASDLPNSGLRFASCLGPIWPESRQQFQLATLLCYYYYDYDWCYFNNFLISKTDCPDIREGSFPTENPVHYLQFPDPRYLNPLLGALNDGGIARRAESPTLFWVGEPD